MNIAIFGATGKTGNELVKQALKKGYNVTALVRDPSKLLIKNEKLSLVEGDVLNQEDVSKVIQDQDAVICTLGSSELKKTSIRTDGTINIISGMNKENLNRLIIVSAMGIDDSWNTLSASGKFIFATLLKSSRIDHEAQEKAVKESGLDWTIVRPSGLTDTGLTSNYLLGENIKAVTNRISRADVAEMILKELDKNTLIHKAVTITN